MILLQLRIIFRNFKNTQLFSAITILGLTVGMTATILLFTYVQYELSYDRFHEKSARIYRINSILTQETEEIIPICIGLNDSTLQKQVPEIEELLQIYPDNSFDDIPGINRINLKSPEFLDEDLTRDDFENSCVIFDDVECITDKPILKKVMGLLNMLLETGRHSKTSVIYTSHTCCNGPVTKKILNECHSITFFIKTIPPKSMKYLCESYLGLSKNNIKTIKNLKTRPVTIVKSYPKTILSDRSLFIASNDD